ncbi:hypothetical protein VULLAG_LOCUS18979 [Vulpes lagopus]
MKIGRNNPTPRGWKPASLTQVTRVASGAPAAQGYRPLRGSEAGLSDALGPGVHGLPQSLNEKRTKTGRVPLQPAGQRGRGPVGLWILRPAGPALQSAPRCRVYTWVPRCGPCALRSVYPPPRRPHRTTIRLARCLKPQPGSADSSRHS